MSRTPLAVYPRPAAGPPVVFLHGVFMDHSLWMPVLALRPEIDALVADMPGHGDSPATALSSLPEHIDTVLATLDAAGLDRPVVVGHSWGGMVGLRLAASRPDRVAGLVLVNTPLLRTRGSTRAGFRMQTGLLAAGLPAGVYGSLAARALIGAEHRAGHPQDATDLVERTRRQGRRTIRRTLEAVLLDPHDAVDLVADLVVPWAAVAGQDDYVLEGGVGEQLHALGDLRVARGGHTSPLEDPAAVAETIDLVLDRVAARSLQKGRSETGVV